MVFPSFPFDSKQELDCTTHLDTDLTQSFGMHRERHTIQKRRVRVLPYVSKFVTSDNDVNDEPRERYEEQYVFKADSEITYLFRDNDELKMEYMMFLL